MPTVLPDKTTVFATNHVPRYLAEVEMRLHLTAEDVEAALQEQSRDALYRIPAAVQEIFHVKARHTVMVLYQE